MSARPVVNYDPVEEKINFISHAIGAGLALIAGILLIIKGSYLETAQWIGLWVYALSLFLLFAASSLYHFAESPERTYTPFLSIALPTQKAHYLLIALWVIAIIGTLFKLVFIHRFEKISLIAYLLMGWLAVLVMDDMQRFLSKPALTFLIIGGLSYTIGALFYALKKVRYTHAIWHIFVLIGAGSHFLSIYLYVI